MNYDDLYAPLLSDAEITLINAEREERAAAAIAAQSEWHDVTFGGCACTARLPKCNCGLQSWLEPAPVREPIEPIQPDWPLTPTNAALALIAVALGAVLSAFFRMGWAS